MGCYLVKCVFFVYCVIKRIVDHASRYYLYVVTESEISKKFILTVFPKSVILRMKVSFNKTEVIAL